MRVSFHSFIVTFSITLATCGLLTSGCTTTAVSSGVSTGTAPDPAESQTLAERRLAEIYSRQDALTQLYQRNPDTIGKDDLEQRFRSIVHDYEAHLVDHPQDLTARLLFGKFLTQFGQHEAAIEQFLEADRIDPTVPVVKQQIGNYLAETGRYMAAIPYFLNAIDLAPEEPIYYFLLGVLLHEYSDQFIADGFYTRTELEEAMHDAFRNASRLDPDNLITRMRYGESFYDLRNPDWAEALMVWDSMLPATRNPLQYQTVQVHRARVLMNLGETEKAMEALNTVTEPALEYTRARLLEEIDFSPR